MARMPRRCNMRCPGNFHLGGRSERRALWGAAGGCAVPDKSTPSGQRTAELSGWADRAWKQPEWNAWFVGRHGGDGLHRDRAASAAHLREYQKLKRAIRARRPDVAVLIDFPEIHFRLAKEFHRLGVPVIYFVSPQLWAWKQHRIRLVRKYVRRMLVIFPFEESSTASAASRRSTSVIRWRNCRCRRSRASSLRRKSSGPRENLDRAAAGQQARANSGAFAGDAGGGAEISMPWRRGACVPRQNTSL